MRKDYLNIMGLRSSEYEILKVLHTWNHQAVNSNYFNIAKKAELSDSSIIIGLRELKYRGIIEKSVGGCWHIRDGIIKSWNELKGD